MDTANTNLVNFYNSNLLDEMLSKNNNTSGNNNNGSSKGGAGVNSSGVGAGGKYNMAKSYGNNN